MRGVKPLRYFKPVRARGKVYGYFDTGQKDANGKRIYSPLGRMDAPEFGARYAAALGHRTKRADVNPQLLVPRFVDMFQKGEKYRQLADSSKRVYDIYLRSFAEALPTAPAGMIERRDVIALIDQRGNTPGAANLMLWVIGALYKWGRDRGHVTNEPCKDIERLDVGEHEPWPDWLVEEALAGEGRVRLAVHLLYYTAQRIGDVLTIRWSDITNDVLTIRQQKTGKDLQIPLHGKLAAELAKTEKAGLTIIAKNGNRIKEAAMRRELQAWALARGQKIVPHGLRKNAVNALLECGCSAAEAGAISGQSLQVVEHYAKRRAQSRLGGAAILKWERNG